MRIELDVSQMAKPETTQPEKSNPTETTAPPPPSARDKQLIQSIKKGESVSRVRKLIQSGASVNARDDVVENGMTPLMAAVGGLSDVPDRPDLVRLLIEARR